MITGMLFNVLLMREIVLDLILSAYSFTSKIKILNVHVVTIFKNVKQVDVFYISLQN